MQLSPKAIKEFQEIYRKEFGDDIANLEANEMGLRLLNLFKTIYRPIPKNEMKKNERFSNEKLHPSSE
ncbi:hypothetical protein COX25_03485 [bacterium (Candidatus Howlettbacteria) CG23_combo_of_CG06-09_8_20_14_all_37_9]|nr:MAG: hypothetical protein COX25_03485 [bacterium (Candidatus Howlettbacteria) CG23_combo_of_CG06-09_8_20_14_all_37_9]